MSAPAGTVAILMYHSFAPAATREFRPMTVTPARFDEHLHALRDSGFRLIAVRDVPATLAAIRPGERIAVVTIDDGLADGALAAEVLVSHRATATYFIPTSFVAGTARWLEGVEAQRPMMGWPDVVDLERAGMEVGSHGHGHIAADINDDGLIRADAERSRTTLEDALGVAVTSYAYPFGYQRPAARAAIARAGFARACAIFELSACRGDDVFALPRISVGPDTTAEDVVALCTRQWGRAARFGCYQRQRLWVGARRVVRLGPPSAQRIDAAAAATTAEKMLPIDASP